MGYGIELANSEIWFDQVGTYPQGYDSYEWGLKVLNDPSPVGWFYSHQMIMTLEGYAFNGPEAVPYFGIQTRGAFSDPSATHLNGRKVALFSAWGGTHALAGSGPNEGSFPSFGVSSEDFELESYGASCGIDFDWQVGEQLTLKVERSIANLLSPGQAEGTDVAQFECAHGLLAVDTSEFSHGDSSMLLLADGTGDMEGGTAGGYSGTYGSYNIGYGPSAAAPFTPVTAGQQYTASLEVKAAFVTRACKVRLTFYDSSDAVTGTFDSAAIAETLTSFTKGSVTATAPATSTKATVHLWVPSPGGFEGHWIDKLSIRPGTNSAWAPGQSYALTASIKGSAHGNIWYTVGTITGEGSGYPNGGGINNGLPWKALSQYSAVWDEYYGFGDDTTCAGFGHTIAEWSNFTANNAAVLPDHFVHHWGTHDPLTICLARIEETVAGITFTHESGQEPPGQEQPAPVEIPGAPVNAATDFTWLLCDVFTDEIIAELPLRNVRYTNLHKKPGHVDAIFELGDPLLKKLDWRRASAPRQVWLAIDYKGRIDWGGPIWVRGYTGRSSTVNLAGDEWLSFYQHQNITPPSPPNPFAMVFTQVDQFEIFRKIIDSVTIQAGGNINMQVDPSLFSGVKRDRKYWAYEEKQVYEALFQLSQVNNGFEFRIAVEWSGDRPRKRLVLGYPTIGSRFPDSELMFDFPGNMQDYAYIEDATNYADRVKLQGQGEGTLMKRYNLTDQASIQGGIPLMEAVYAYKDVNKIATLAEHAPVDLAYRSTLTKSYPVQLGFDSPPLGMYFVGDDAQVRITDDRFPQAADGGPGFVDNGRILTKAVAVDEGAVTLEIGQFYDRD